MSTYTVRFKIDYVITTTIEVSGANRNAAVQIANGLALHGATIEDVLAACDTVTTVPDLRDHHVTAVIDVKPGIGEAS